MLLFKDNLATDITNKALLAQVLQELQTKDFLDPQALELLNLIKSQKPLAQIK